MRSSVKVLIFGLLACFFLINSSGPVQGKSDLRELKPQKKMAKHKKGEIIVKYKGDKHFKRVSLSVGDDVEKAIKRYRSRSEIQYAEPNYIAYALFIPNDDFYLFQWHLDNPVSGGIDMESAWDLNTGSGVIVAVIDSGVAYENYNAGKGKKYFKAPDLANTNFASGYDFVNDDEHPNDDNSHGTHVTGTIAQSTNNEIGVAGVAFNAIIMPIKVLNKEGSGTYADIAEGIRLATDNEAKVINLSLGGPVPATYLEEALAYAYNAGVTIVAAAGNDATDTPSYPAAYDDYVISVGATRYDETLAYYSNFGPNIDLVAPGGDLTVDQNGDGYGDGVLQNTFNPTTKKTSEFSYWFLQGTSMASPHVAGVAALVISLGNATSPDEVRQALESTSKDLGASGRDDTYGHGLVNAFAALNWTSGETTTTTTTTTEPTTTTTTPTTTTTTIPDMADEVNIEKAEYRNQNGELRVEATSSLGSTVTMTVSSPTTGYNYGEMTFNQKKGLFKLKVRGVPDPGSQVRVDSSAGGNFTSTVKHK